MDNLTPVPAEKSGEGLPYAPENWPKPGDKWGWRTGRRVASTGHFLDRYLYVPIGFSRNENSGSNRKQRLCFPSKLSVERYIKANFPETDVNEFFASFTWKIPAIPPEPMNGNLEPMAVVPLQQIPASALTELDLQSDFLGCKVQNKTCSSLILEKEQENLPIMPCDICCAEPGFCRNCCCILCCKTVDSDYGGYSYIRCLAKIGNNICGHIAHMECALRSRLAGTIGGSIGLDTEYHCRRCDGRTDLIPLVKKFLQTCKTIDSRDAVEKMLNLGSCLLRGTKKTIAQELLHHIEVANVKLKCGTHLEDIWKVEDNYTDGFAGVLENDNGTEDVVHDIMSVDFRAQSYGPMYETLKLEIEVDRVLHALRKSQEFEYKLAEDRLHAQMNYVKNLYQQLSSEKSGLAMRQGSSPGVSVDAIRKREEQLKREVMKLDEMKKVANGFGKTPKDILKEHFDLEFEQ